MKSGVAAESQPGAMAGGADAECVASQVIAANSAARTWGTRLRIAGDSLVSFRVPGLFGGSLVTGKAAHERRERERHHKVGEGDKECE